MKKIALLCILILFINCSGSGVSEDETGFTEPDNFTETFSWDQTKSFSFTGIGNESCSGDQCAAIIYRGTVGSSDYTGIAVNDRHNADWDFFLKIYKTDSETDYTIKLYKAGSSSETTTDQISISSGVPAAGYSTITFTGNITIGSYQISNGETIVAKEYPE